MKKSNKLLLGGFLTVMLTIVGIHIALFAKYKNGHYTIYHPEDKRADDKMQSFPNVAFVIVRNVHSVTVQFGEKAGVEKGKEDVIQYSQQGDSLFITGQYAYGAPDSRRLLNITLPYNTTLFAINSSLYFEKGKKDAENNTVIHLQKSYAYFEAGPPFVLGNVKIIASDISFAAFRGNMQINHLDVQLSNSRLEYNEGDVGQLSIATDSLSRISLRSKNLLKAKITTIPN